MTVGTRLPFDGGQRRFGKPPALFCDKTAGR